MTFGRMEAIINKLGGEEGVENFLRGETKIVKTDPQLGKSIYSTALTLPADYRSSYGKLTPKKTYLIQLFPLLENNSFSDFMEFLETKGNVILTGMEGLHVLVDYLINEIPRPGFINSIDEIENLPKQTRQEIGYGKEDGPHSVVPCLELRENFFSYNYCSLEKGYDIFDAHDQTLLCISELR